MSVFDASLFLADDSGVEVVEEDALIDSDLVVRDPQPEYCVLRARSDELLVVCSNASDARERALRAALAKKARRLNVQVLQLPTQDAECTAYVWQVNDFIIALLCLFDHAESAFPFTAIVEEFLDQLFGGVEGIGTDTKWIGKQLYTWYDRCVAFVGRCVEDLDEATLARLLHAALLGGRICIAVDAHVGRAFVDDIVSFAQCVQVCGEPLRKADVMYPIRSEESGVVEDEWGAYMVVVARGWVVAGRTLVDLRTSTPVHTPSKRAVTPPTAPTLSDLTLDPLDPLGELGFAGDLVSLGALSPTKTSTPPPLPASPHGGVRMGTLIDVSSESTPPPEPAPPVAALPSPQKADAFSAMRANMLSMLLDHTGDGVRCMQLLQDTRVQLIHDLNACVRAAMEARSGELYATYTLFARVRDNPKRELLRVALEMEGRASDIGDVLRVVWEELERVEE